MKKSSVIILSILAVAQFAISQVPDFSKVPNLYENDSLSITSLVHHGIKIERRKAICWFPADSLAELRMNGIADTINTGITAAEKFIHAPLDWQAHSFNVPYVFYFRSDTFISHASAAGFVSISFWRIKNGKAPWLHEVLHEMLDTKNGSWLDKTITDEDWKQNMPLWLFEGLPDYISFEVSQANNLYLFDVFSNSSNMNIDSIFKEDMNEKSKNTAYILSHIGEKGVMPELSSKDRNLYAPGFYHGSCSFVKYIAGNYGINILLLAISSFKKEQETIEKLSGKPLATLKKEWLQKLKIAE